jgi:hypothetical protein
VLFPITKGRRVYSVWWVWVRGLLLIWGVSYFGGEQQVGVGEELRDRGFGEVLF